MTVTRTEAEAVADAVAELLVRHLLRQQDRMAATAAVGLTYDDVTAALARRRHIGYQAPARTPSTPTETPTASSAAAPAGEPKRYQRAPGPAPEGTKWCGYHAQFHPHAEFARNAAATDGMQNRCKAAQREYAAARRQRS